MEILPNTSLFSLSIELPKSTCRAAVHVAFDNDHLAADSAWEDIPMDLSAPMPEVNIDISYEGGEYFHFIQMA